MNQMDAARHVVSGGTSPAETTGLLMFDTRDDGVVGLSRRERIVEIFTSRKLLTPSPELF